MPVRPLVKNRTYSHQQEFRPPTSIFHLCFQCKWTSHQVLILHIRDCWLMWWVWVGIRNTWLEDGHYTIFVLKLIFRYWRVLTRPFLLDSLNLSQITPVLRYENDIWKTVLAWYLQSQFDMCQFSRIHLMAETVEKP